MRTYADILHLEAVAMHGLRGGRRVGGVPGSDAGARSEALRALYDRPAPDRAPHMPLLGLLSGFLFALTLWSGIAWLVLAVVR